MCLYNSSFCYSYQLSVQPDLGSLVGFIYHSWVYNNCKHNVNRNESAWHLSLTSQLDHYTRDINQLKNKWL